MSRDADSTKHVKKMLHAFPRAPHIDSGCYRRPQSTHRALHMCAEVEFEPKTRVKIQYEKDTYGFDLQGVNFSLDFLLFLVVRSLVRSASTIFNERDC